VFFAEKHTLDTRVRSARRWTYVRRMLIVLCFSVWCVSASDGLASDAGQALFERPVSSDISRVASKVLGSVRRMLRRV